MGHPPIPHIHPSILISQLNAPRDPVILSILHSLVLAPVVLPRPLAQLRTVGSPRVRAVQLQPLTAPPPHAQPTGPVYKHCDSKLYCGSVLTGHKRFGAICCLCLQDRSVNVVIGSPLATAFLLITKSFLPCSSEFYPVDEGNKLPRNIGTYFPDYTMSRSRSAVA
jgi:hypothetical protein